MPNLTSGHPYARVDERLCAEDDGECEPFGVLSAGFGGADRDPQVVAGDDEGVAVEPPPRPAAHTSKAAVAVREHRAGPVDLIRRSSSSVSGTFTQVHGEAWRGGRY